MANPEKFGELLTQGIYAIKSRSGDSIHVIQNELEQTLHRSSETIRFWRKGNVPREPEDVKRVAQYIIKKGGLSSNWLGNFLYSADYPWEPWCDELDILQAHTEVTNTAISTIYLPNSDYFRFIGRQPISRKILSELSKKSESLIVSLDGQGGVGKTAVALEVAKQCIERSIFEDVVWITSSRPTARDTIGTGQKMTFDTVLEQIGFQLAIQNFTNLKPEKKAQRIREILNYRRVLIILDNMETSEEPQQTIIAKLLPILGISKVLATSRKRFRSLTFSINLKGLGPEDSFDFIKQHAKERNISHIENASMFSLKKIIQTTGGSPLALKLVVSQMRNHKVEEIATRLQLLKPLRTSDKEDEYLNFYKFVFHDSWNMLNNEPKRVLVRLANFNSLDGATFTALHTVSQLEYEILILSIDDLWDLSFLEIDAISPSEMRYYIHPLTKHFVLADIVKILR